SSSVFCTAEKPIDINSNNDSEQKAKIIKELEESWSAPERVYSIEANRKRTQVSVAAYGVQSKKLGLLQWEDDFKRVTEFPEPLIKTDGQDGFFIRRKLTQAITRYQDSGNFEDLQPFIAFLRQNPDSAWNSSILLNMAKISYQTGYFSNALKYWKKCWEISKEKADENGVKIASLAISEYAKMNARVGRMDEVKRAFDQAKNCELKGNARIIMDGAIEGHYAMENNPGIAFRCGPYALSNIIKEHYPDKANRIKEFLDRTQSPREGFSLERVEQMSSELGINMQIARRKPGASVIIPSVMHLKVGHFGAIIRKQGDKYLLKDPTFGNQTWLSSDAIDEEGSGFFIVPGGQLPEGWKKPEKAEFKKIYGKGHSGNGGEDETKECSKQSGGNKKTCAMATHSFHTLLASLHIEDTPINYSAARGMDIAITVSYNQREFEGQSISYLYSNFGPQWVSSWVSYLVDNTTVTGSDVTLYLPNGGSEVHTNFNSNTQRYEAQVQGSSVLEVLTNDTYKKVLPDGTEIFYEHFIGTTGTSRRVFMSRIVDPQGNQINLAYDTNPSYPERIIKITDATGLETDFSYAYSGEPYLVTSIEDPY
ncbi:MAG: cysteine peptidase family C39 domain-containing protein, partial [Bacteroidota bacterium]